MTRTKKVLDTRVKLAAEAALMQKNKVGDKAGQAGEKAAENIIEEDPDIIF